MKRIFMFGAAMVLATSSLFAQAPKDGSNAVVITNTVAGAWTGDTALDIDANKITVTPGDTLNFSFWARSANHGSAQMEKAQIAFFNGGTFLNDTLLWSGEVTQYWTQKSGTAVVPANATVANVSFRVAAGGNPSYSIMIDDVRLRKSTAATVELLPNASFETWTGASTAAPDSWRFFAVSGAAGNVKKYSPPAGGGRGVLTQIWKIDASTTGPLPWFGSTSDNMTRGMDINPQTGNLVVIDRQADFPMTTSSLYFLDAATGAQVGSVELTNIMTEGRFGVNKVACDDSGRIFICNLTVVPASPATQGNLRVYMYPSQAAALTGAPAVALSADNVPIRFGDDMDVVGSGSSTRIALSGANTTGVLMLTDPENDGVFTSTTMESAGMGGGVPGIAFEVGGLLSGPSRFWFHQSAATNQVDCPALAYLNTTGAPQGAPFNMNVGVNTGPIDVGFTVPPNPADSVKVLALGPGNIGAGNPLKGYVFNMAINADKPMFETGPLGGNSGLAIGNTNGTGDVVLDEANKRVFFLVTNNSISSWALPDVVFSSAADWQYLQ